MSRTCRGTTPVSADLGYAVDPLVSVLDRRPAGDDLGVDTRAAEHGGHDGESVGWPAREFIVLIPIRNEEPENVFDRRTRRHARFHLSSGAATGRGAIR